MLTILTTSWILNILIEKCFSAGPSYLQAVLTAQKFDVGHVSDVLGFGHFQGGVPDEWGYYQGGVPPRSWHTFPGSSDCGGSNQSPVNIQIENVIKESSFPDFDFKELKQPIAMKMTNDGRRVDVIPSYGKPLISGGGIPGIYQLQGFHFHWGKQNGKGSEHRVNGKQHAIELHFQFDKVDEIEKSINQRAVVIAVLIDVGEYNPKYSTLVNGLQKILDVGNSTVLPNFPIIDFFPDRVDCYYRYFGSLTTPPCTESIIWTVLADTVYISKSQMKKFHKLMGKGHIFTNSKRLIEDAFRPIQNLNGRQVKMFCS